MIVESSKHKVYFPKAAPHVSLMPIADWIDRRPVPFEYNGNVNVLDWIIANKFSFAPDCKPLRDLSKGVGRAFNEYWATNASVEGFSKGANPFFKTPDGYRLWVGRDGRSLTVAKGNEKGRFFDQHPPEGRDPINWPALGKGLLDLGIRQAAPPASIGRVASSLLFDFKVTNARAVPNRVLTLAWDAAKGSRMEGLTFGSFEGFSYDISSAFPHAAHQLPAADHAWEIDWVEGNTFQDSAYYGFARCDVKIPPMKAGPIAVRVGQEYADDLALVFPTGRIRVTLSMPEMRLLNDMGIHFKILKGIWGYPLGDFYPFRGLMKVLWQLRSADSQAAKSLSVACVGRLGQVNDDFVVGPHWSPVYFAHIYAETRCRIYRKALEIGLENVRAFCIDGLIVNCKMAIDRPGMGAWRLESRGQYFLATDFLKDRPGGPARWRQAVENTGRKVKRELFTVDMPHYVTLNEAISAPASKWAVMGETKVIKESLRLGPGHRRIEGSPERSDYLMGPIDSDPVKA